MDGAHQGVDARRALDTVLGGEPGPQDTKEDTMTPARMREKLEAAVRDGMGELEGVGYSEMSEKQRGDAYDQAASIAGGRILAWLDEHPEYARVPGDPKTDWDDREKYTGYHIVYAGLDDLMKVSGIDVDEGLGLSGFQFGWAVNAAKYAFGAPPVQNPAIVTIGEGE